MPWKNHFEKKIYAHKDGEKPTRNNNTLVTMAIFRESEKNIIVWFSSKVGEIKI